MRFVVPVIEVRVTSVARGRAEPVVNRDGTLADELLADYNVAALWPDYVMCALSHVEAGGLLKPVDRLHPLRAGE
jgi:hypothetical protein